MDRTLPHSRSAAAPVSSVLNTWHVHYVGLRWPFRMGIQGIESTKLILSTKRYSKCTAYNLPSAYLNSNTSVWSACQGSVLCNLSPACTPEGSTPSSLIPPWSLPLVTSNYGVPDNYVVRYGYRYGYSKQPYRKRQYIAVMLHRQAASIKLLPEIF